MESNRNFFALAVFAGLAIIGVMLPVSVGRFTASTRTVSVKGLCEREVSADKVIWPIKFKVVGNDLAAVYREVESKNDVVASFLEKGGVKADEITRAVPAISDKYTQEYGSNDRAFRYVATSTITVCSKDVALVKRLIDSQNVLLESGVAPQTDWDCGVSYSFEGLNDIKPEMIQEATRNAREVAQKFAQDSRSRLGKIKQANQGTFSIEDRDANTPSIKKVRVVTNVVYFLSR